MAVRGIFRKSGGAVLVMGLLGTAGVWYFSNWGVHSLEGEWTVVDARSKEDALARLNVRKGTVISIDDDGYLKTGKISIDGIIGEGICGINCGTFTANGLKQTYEVSVDGESNTRLTLTDQKLAAVIVLERAHQQFESR